MAIEINNNTILRLIVRRGSEDDRRLATLAIGELAYTIDTQRLYIGVDSQVGTGVVAGNKFLGVLGNRNYANDIAQVGDMVFDSNTNCLFALSADGAWANISPSLYNLQYTANGTRVSNSLAGYGLNLAYTDSGTLRNLQNAYGSIQFDSNYLSIDQANNDRLFIGNVTTDPWSSSYGSNAKLITNGSAYINGTNNQIVLSANSTGTSINFNNSAGNYGYTYFNIASSLKLIAHSPTAAGSAAIISVSGYPGFDFSGGCGIFRNGLVVQGGAVIDNLIYNSAMTLSVTSIRIDTSTQPALTALVITYTGAPVAVQVDVNSNGHDSLYIDTRPFVGIHTKSAASYYPTYSTAISGSTLQLGNLTVSGGNVTVYGDISATGDIIGFFSSDMALKQNINPITNALDKLMSLKGVEFDWNSKSIYSGHDVGVLAQDVEEVLPSAVGRRHDGYKGVQYDKIIPLIIEAIRELKSSK